MHLMRRQAAKAACLCIFVENPMRRFVFLVATLASLAAGSLAQDFPTFGNMCGTTGTRALRRATDDIGGRHLTDRGTLRILLVFASFPDDDTPNPFWPPHQPPLAMRQFIDPDTSTGSTTAFNLTNYFRQMSLGQFHLVGDVVWIESHHSMTEYSNGSYGRANTNLLTEQLDSIVDFSKYDSWTNVADYMNAGSGDGLVDMIVMVWRTNIFPYIGEASLGRKPTVVLDGVRVGMGFPEDYANPVGSGVTCEFLYNDTPEKVMRTIAHELGHWLLGGPHPYNSDVLGGKHSYWGILCDGKRIASCMNAYEREQLGWITIPEVRPDSTYLLPDYISTGISLKYHPADGSPLEYFYLENHQRRSVFDDVSVNSEDRGVWILHQQGPYQELDNLRTEPSDGRWQWDDRGIRNSCFGQPLTLFHKGDPAVQRGPSHRDMIATQATEVNWLYMIQDADDTVRCGQFFAGESFTGAFDTNHASVFSRFSNPSSNTWDGQASGFTFEITGNIEESLTVATFSDGSGPSPARRHLGFDPGLQTVQGAPVPLAWGTQWQDGQPIEPDVDRSELQRMDEGAANWKTVYDGPLFQWTDHAVTHDSIGGVKVQYRVRVGDSRGKLSNWSAPCVVRTTAQPSAVSPHGEGVEQFRLQSNYPNPFNPKTVISGQWPGDSDVRLVVYDVLGRQVATLANSRYPAGKYSFTFDGANLASGVYFYRLTAGSFSAVRTMLLLR